MTGTVPSFTLWPMECLRCGKCCFGPFYKLTRPEDVADWERDGISVPLEAYGEESGSTDHANHEMAALGMPFHTCRFLTPDGDRFLCSIYEHRPRTCREFEPGCSRLCPQYKGKKR